MVLPEHSQRGCGAEKEPLPPVAEPFYIRQSAEVMTDAEQHAWFRQVAMEAKEAGATFARFSYHPDIPNLRIVEGWLERPDDQGEIRWAITAAREHSSPRQTSQPIREGQ